LAINCGPLSVMIRGEVPGYLSPARAASGKKQRRPWLRPLKFSKVACRLHTTSRILRRLSQNCTSSAAQVSLVQQVPKPSVHAILRLATHLANLKHVRSIVFEVRNSNELERKGFALAAKGGLSENQPSLPSSGLKNRKVPSQSCQAPFRRSYPLGRQTVESRLP